MVNKIKTTISALMIILLVSTVFTNVRANIHAAEIINQQTNNQTTENLSEENNKENNIKAPARGRVEYSVTKASGIEEKSQERSVDPNKPMIAITYDDGPSKYTPEILKVLKENNSVATFFVLGYSVNNNKDLLNQMIEDGNQIGNHTYNHNNLTKITDEELYKQIQGTDDLIYMATGYTPTVMRPPFGATNEEINKKVQKPVIQWSVDTRDWESKNTQMIVDSILGNVSDGDIILMHDLYGTTAEASKIVIPELINSGFQLVTIDELFEHKEVPIVVGEQYYKVNK